MELSIWYSYNHKCFKTRIGYIPWDSDLDYVNGFDEELVAYIPLIYPKLKFKQKVIRFLKKAINRLEK